jgi:protein-tyrosine phosphatase
VWLGDIGALRSLPEGVDAVVSLCRVGNVDLPARDEQIDVRLIDQPGVNENLDFVLLDTVRAVEQLRRDGRTVLIHCVQAQSRTPTVAALYGARLRGIGIAEALADVRDVLPNAQPIPEFCAALRRLHQMAHETPDV